MIERIVFALLAAVSVWYFAWVSWGRLGGLRGAKGKLPLDHIPHRLWRVFKKVVLQEDVIRGRPVVGVLHALVVWGFFAFTWISAEHLFLGLRGLDAAKENSGWYGFFVAIWACAVIVGISGLAWRRFVMSPKVLGPLSKTSGIVAFLIFALMATYLFGWRLFEVDTTAWRINWWVHTIAFFVMLCVIPKSKHFHLVLAPFAIFFGRETTSPMRLLDFEKGDFGLINPEDLSAKDILDVHACVECGRCTSVCPANAVGLVLDPKQIILKMQKWSGVSEEEAFQCLTCGACEEVCPVGIEHVGRKILGLRQGMVSEGRTVNEQLNTLFSRFERSANPFGLSWEARRKFIETAKFPIFDGSQEWLFWMGCGMSFGAGGGHDTALVMQKILNRSGVSWGVLPEESCCGEPARRTGNEYLFRELAKKLIKTLRDNKVKKIVTCCPHCFKALNGDYRQIPADLEEQLSAYNDLGIVVAHHTQFIVASLQKLQLKPGGVRRVLAYHDPCQLARGCGMVKEPRLILGACGEQTKELPRHGERTHCCGAGGGRIFLEKEIRGDSGEKKVGRVNDERFAEILSANVDGVVVGCGYCRLMLKDAALRAGREDFGVFDIAEIVAQQL